MSFVEKDVTVDRQAAMEMVRRSRQQGVPVITAGDDVIVGFDQQRLARIADRQSAPMRPPFGVFGANAVDYASRHPEELTLPQGVKGVYVGKVREGSVAARGGIRSGDVITGIAGKRVNDLGALDRLVKTVRADDTVPVGVYRNGGFETVKVTFSA